MYISEKEEDKINKGQRTIKNVVCVRECVPTRDALVRVYVST